MRILHLSDTGLSGSPIRISQLLDKKGISSKHICWLDRVGYRVYDVDVVGSKASPEELRYLIYEWATHIHYHNRWKRQEVFKALRSEPPKKPSVIQIHSPRDSEDFSEEVKSRIPLAVIAQYHVRQWPDLRFIVPNVVDIERPEYEPMASRIGRLSPSQVIASLRPRPTISYAPSNTNATGWNDKGYNVVNPVLKRMRMNHEIIYDLIQGKPFKDTMRMKSFASLGVDDIVSGSYHLSALEYLALGVGCVDHLDALTEKVLKDITGAEKTPFIDATKDSFERVVKTILKEDSFAEEGKKARAWMETYWSPDILADHYRRMYHEIS